MNKALLILTNDGYEALYVNNQLIEQGSPINEGNNRTSFFINLAKIHNFNIEDLVGIYPKQEFLDEVEECGSFPDIFDEKYLIKE